jgi:hypothetical protein
VRREGRDTRSGGGDDGGSLPVFFAHVAPESSSRLSPDAPPETEPELYAGSLLVDLRKGRGPAWRRTSTPAGYEGSPGCLRICAARGRTVCGALGITVAPGLHK